MEGFVKIKDPDKPGDYLVLSGKDYDPATHAIFNAEPEAETSEPAKTAAEPEAETKSWKGRRK